MITILFTFIIALGISLLLTPLARWFGIKFGAMDVPNERKVHTKATPRTGGLGIFITFILVLVVSWFLKTDLLRLLVLDQITISFLCGALIVFAIGFLDDFYQIHAGIKLFFHVVAAMVAFFGGLKIGAVGFFSVPSISMISSFLLTVFWFVLVINAVNLMDGLDGLAGGIVVFSCVVIIVPLMLQKHYLPAMLFSALGGATLGFLRYNLNPAKIFLGDGGSYFLGYAIAGLSIMSGAKTQIGAIMLIPILALGVPLFDTFLAPFRRFIRGKELFSPDNDHIHHKLKNMGLSSNKVVWMLYGVTFVLCIAAVIVVNLRNEKAGLFLIALGLAAIFFVRKLGYFEYFATEKIYGWFRDITDVTGLSHNRRTFLNVQMDMNASKDFEGLWENAVKGMEMLGFDLGELVLRKTLCGKVRRLEAAWVGSEENAGAKYDDGSCGERVLEQRWSRNGFDGEKDLCNECLLKLELPLIGEDGENLGTLWLMKDLKREPVTHYTLSRIEHLRRTLISTLGKI